MISQLIKPLGCTRTLLKLYPSKFSTNPTPNQGPSNNEDKPEVKIQNLSKTQQKDSQSQNQKLRAQARLRVSRAELSKYARIELDYEKVNNQAEKLQKVTKYLKNFNFKIKPHPDHGARLQFYRTQEVNRQKPTPRKQQENKDANKDEKKEQDFEETIAEIEEDEIEFEVKIFTSAVKQFDRREAEQLDELFERENLLEMSDDPIKSLAEKMGVKNDKTFNEAYNTHKRLFKNLRMKRLEVELSLDKLNQKSSQSDQANQNLTDTNNEDRFKEFSVYLRNGNNKSTNADKWMKVELLMQDFNQVHLCNVSVINNIENELKGTPLPNNSYQTIQAKQLDPQVIKLVHDFLWVSQGVSPEILTAVYYYTIHYETLVYRKWLEDLIDTTK